MSRRRLLSVALLACGVIAALLLPASASAVRGLTIGFEDGDEFQSADPAERDLWSGRAADAGAGIVRVAVIWPAIAPNQPADPTNPGSTSYDFSSVDGAVRAARARGLTVVLAVNGAPDWAEESGRPPAVQTFSWKPIPSDVADFMQAVAARYAGGFDSDGAGVEPPLPAAQAMEVWNEVNSSDWITPQFEGKNAVSPERYRSMLNLSYKAIKSVNPGMLVVAGATEPYGDRPGGPYPPGGARVQPVQFWQQLLCVRQVNSKAKSKKKGKKKAAKFVGTNCPAKPQFDVLSHHPIDNTGGGPLRSGPMPGDASTPDLGRVVQVLRAAERLGKVPGGHHPVWATEFWWDSNPPNPVGAPLIQQARWIEQTFYFFWKAGASVAINFQIADASTRPDVHAGYQAGVYFEDGRPKPSLTAFRFPFVTERINQRTLRAWGKTPESGKLKIQRQQGSRWKTVRKLRVAKGAVFQAKLRLSGKQRLRAAVGASRSVVWKQAAAGGHKASEDGEGPSAALIALLVAAGIGLIVAIIGVVRRHQMQRQNRPRAVIG